MANSSQGDQNANRTIIIPRGVLDPNQVNVINIPRKMNTSAPLLVTARKEGGFKSQTLPIWKDELSSPGKLRACHDLRVTPKACSAKKGNDSTFSSVYDSSAEMEVNASDFFQNVGIGEYNVITPMTPSPERLWPKLPEHRGGRGFMPHHMSSPQEGIDAQLVNDSSFPSTMYSQDFIDPDMSGLQELSASSKSSETDVECLCASGEAVNATFDQPQNANATFNRPQNANATFNRPQNANATFDRPQNPNATYNQAPRANSTFIQPQNPNATFIRPQNLNATYNQAPRFNSTFIQPQTPNATFIRPQQANATYDRPQDFDGTFSQSQNPNQSYGQYGDQFSEYQQPVYPSDNTFNVPSGEQPYLGNETFNVQQSSSYRNAPAAPGCGGPSDTSGAYQVCSNMEEDPYSPRIVHMSSRTFTQVNDNPPESLSITVDAPDGVDQHALRYATQMATFGDSGARTDESYFADQSYSSPSPPRAGGRRAQQQGGYRTFTQGNDEPPERSMTMDEPAGRYATQMATFGDSGPRTDDSYFADQTYVSQSGGRQDRPSQKGNTGYGFKEHSAGSKLYPSGGFGQQYGFQEQGMDNLKRSGCNPACYGTCNPNRKR